MAKVEIKTVEFDTKSTETLMNIARAVVEFPEYPGIREAAGRMLRKLEQDLAEKIAKVREEEAKAAAEAEAKKAADAKAAADAEAKKAEQQKGKAA
jgi:hypothetical protein